MSQLAQGQVIAAFSRQYLAELSDKTLLSCLTHGKKSDVACGDIVEIQKISDTQGVIKHVIPRQSLLYRSDKFKQKIIASNITQVIIVVASKPLFNDELLTRCLIAAHDQNLSIIIVLNKCDLSEEASTARQKLEPYRTIGYNVIELTAKKNCAPLRPFLQGHTSVLIGESGMGKSTIINELMPNAQVATREISIALNSGKHTTTHARLYHLDTKSHLMDCPGVKVFGLHHLNFSAIEAGFIEFEAYQGQCRFHNCRHTNEPGCAIKIKEGEGKINTRRLAIFQKISQGGS